MRLFKWSQYKENVNREKRHFLFFLHINFIACGLLYIFFIFIIIVKKTFLHNAPDDFIIMTKLEMQIFKVVIQ